ncbi:MAG: hypothetical protein ABR550_11645 [Wenzhouxiangellaceae bacterium]
MQVTIHSTKPRKAKRSKVQARFDRLRERIEREQSKNERLSRELDELARWLAAQRQEIERDVLEAAHRLGARLIEFFKRKSLSEWHREELVEWIAEMREQVSAIDPDAGAELHQRFVEAVSIHLDMSVDEMEAQFREHFEGDDAEFDLDAEDELEDDVQPDLFGDEEDSWREPEWNGRDERAWQAGPAGEAPAADSRLADAGWLRSLFRRAAQALHPDRETDPDQRAHKHERMQELLRARKDGDVLAMLALYAEASGDEELALAETEMKQACELMQQRLERLQHERTEITGKSPLHAWAHQEFYRISRKQREQKIKRLEREAQAEARDVTRIADELKNLKVLKAHLSRRREQKYEELNDLDDFFDSLFR